MVDEHPHEIRNAIEDLGHLGLGNRHARQLREDTEPLLQLAPPALRLQALERDRRLGRERRERGPVGLAHRPGRRVAREQRADVAGHRRQARQAQRAHARARQLRRSRGVDGNVAMRRPRLARRRARRLEQLVRELR